MIIRSQIFRRVTIVGVGLMGGSLGMAIKKHRLAKEVVGLSHRQSSLMQAIKVKAIDVGQVDVKKAVNNADLIILATPVSSIIKLLSTINPHLKRGCIVTDVGSTKVEILDAAQKSLSVPSMFIGCHPLAGSERKGADAATADLFQDAHCILTPTKETNQVARKKMKHFWTQMGSKVSIMPPEEHDEILSYISHLPHLLAYSLMEIIPDKYLEFASKGLKDTTRIAASSPKLWQDIILSNPKNVLKSLDELVKLLGEVRKTIIKQDQKVLLNHLTKAKDKRDGIN